MRHPNFLDRLAIKIFPRFLYPGQLAFATGRIQIGIVHKTPSAKIYWKVTDYLQIEMGSILRYRGLVRSLKISGDVDPLYSVFDIVQANTAMDVTESGHHISVGDAVIVLPADRRFIYPAPETSAPAATAPVYYTAESPPAS